MPATDPFTQIHNALWSLVEANTTLAGLVPNRVKLGGDDSDPATTDASVAALPRLLLEPKVAALQAVRDSHKGTVTMHWSWILDTGSKWPSAMFYPVLWEMYRTLADWKTALTALTWNSKPYVFNTVLRRYDAETDARNRNRNSHGWSGLLTCVVEMQFDRSDLPPD